ncbi:MAG: hypothetical protein ACXAAM_02685, partial [Candidatus Heimdallarchaeaceae archaeon]
MSQDTAKKVGLIVLFIAIIVGSVFGVLYGILGLAWTGERGFIALIIGSVLAFIGAVYGIYRVSFTIRIDRAQGKEISKRNPLAWIITAIISGAGAILTYFLGMKTYHFNPTLMIILIVILASVCLFS